MNDRKMEPRAVMSPIAGQDILDKLAFAVYEIKVIHDAKYAEWDETTRDERAAARKRSEAEQEEENARWQSAKDAAIEKYRYAPFRRRRTDEEAREAAVRNFEPALWTMPPRFFFYEKKGPKLPDWYAEADELLTAARTFPDATFEVRVGLIHSIEETYRALAP